MDEMTQEQIGRLIAAQRACFAQGETRDVASRVGRLKDLRQAIRRNETRIAEALQADLHKSPGESYLTEVGIVLAELDNHIRHLRRWSRTRRVPTPLFLWPSRSRVMYEPLGVVLIVAPWNYPFQLLLNPLVGALSAGCCAVLKASPYAPCTARVVDGLLREVFPERQVCLVQGGRETNRLLFEQRFDLIFFTGSPSLGRVVMTAAARHLTPVVLELGGKSPCIVDRSADLALAARRIAWGKTVNAGQTCIAPDYLFVHEEVKEAFLDEMRRAWHRLLGDDPRRSPRYARMVSTAAAARLRSLMQAGTVVAGGEVDEEARYVAPTIIDGVRPDDPVMQQEIFGPLLPVMTFCEAEEVIAYINAHDKPLALYYFGSGRRAREVLGRTTSGGVCINDTLMHIANHHLPFGGVGASGMGRYHGRRSFLAFSNERAVVTTPTRVDLPVKYAPSRYYRLLKRLLG